METRKEGVNLPFIDILIFAVIAVLLVLRLRSVLGQRTGYEEPQDKIDELFFSNDLSFQSLVFDGFGHNPEDFGKRFEGALNFLLKDN